MLKKDNYKNQMTAAMEARGIWCSKSYRTAKEWYSLAMMLARKLHNLTGQDQDQIIYSATSEVRTIARDAGILTTREKYAQNANNSSDLLPETSSQQAS